MFDFFKDLFDDWFGGNKDGNEDLSPWGGDDDISFSPAGSDLSGFDFGDYVGIEERLIDPDQIGEGEFANEFYSLVEAYVYVDGTPESVLKIVPGSYDNDGEEMEVYHVYRYASE